MSSRVPFAIRRRAASRSIPARSISIRWTFPRRIFAAFTSIKIAACGTSWHAGLAGKYMIEQLARVPVEVDYASEFRYRDPVLERERPSDRHFAIGRDGRHDRRDARGETGRLQGARDLQRSGLDDHTRGRRHDPDARRARDRRCVDKGVYVADGRAVYVCDVSRPGPRQRSTKTQAKKLAQDLAELPLKIEQLLNDADSIEELSKEFFRVQDFLYLGRGINFPVALEGALKIKRDQLHPRRRLSGRRDEARPERSDR